MRYAIDCLETNFMLLPRKSPGTVLPLCLFVISGTMAFGLYCWRELSFTIDLVHEQSNYHKHFYEAENLFTKTLHEITTKFTDLQQTIQTRKQPLLLPVLPVLPVVTATPPSDQHATTQTWIYGIADQPASLRIVMLFFKKQIHLITLSCRIMRHKKITDQERYDYMVHNFTIGNVA